MYTVLWKPSAEAHLAEIWSSTPDRAAVTAAANQLDRDLRDDPFDTSESREGDERIAFQLPLAIRFFVVEADMKVFVYRVSRVVKRHR